MSNVYAKLTILQNELKAPKNQYNRFGKYKYRNCEDILEAVKPLLLAHQLTLFVNDEIVQVADRFYIKAVGTLVDSETNEKIVASAFARESLTKKGMDDAQVTGATSSYARKYMLNGLFAIDDTKDADTDEFKQQQDKKGDNDKMEELSKLTKQYTQLRTKMNELKIDFRSEKINAWILEKAKVSNQEISNDLNHMKRLIKCYQVLVDNKKNG